MRTAGEELLSLGVSKRNVGRILMRCHLPEIERVLDRYEIGGYEYDLPAAQCRSTSW